MSGKIYVRCGAPDNRKCRRLAKLLDIDQAYAFGLTVSLWEKVWTEEVWDARLSGWEPQDIAHACRWTYDIEMLVTALYDAGVLCSEKCRHGKPSDGVPVVHDWVEEQGPLVKKLQADRSRSRGEREGQDVAPPAQASEGEDTVTKTLMHHADRAKIRGRKDTLRSYIEGWRADNAIGAEKVEKLLMSPEAAGKDIIWLNKALSGNGSKNPEQRGKDIVDEVKRRMGRGANS